jgi:ribosomal protein L11
VTVVPSAAALVIKALKEPPRDRKKVKNIKHSGNVTMDDIINAARIMRPRSMAKEFSGESPFLDITSRIQVDCRPIVFICTPPEIVFLQRYICTI